MRLSFGAESPKYLLKPIMTPLLTRLRALYNPTYNRLISSLVKRAAKEANNSTRVKGPTTYKGTVSGNGTASKSNRPFGLTPKSTHINSKTIEHSFKSVEFTQNIPGCEAPGSSLIKLNRFAIVFALVVGSDRPAGLISKHSHFQTYLLFETAAFSGQTLRGLKFIIYLFVFCGRSQNHKMPTNGTHSWSPELIV